jgi:hypothetical protein
MENIRKALSIAFDAVEPTAGGYWVSNSSNPNQESVLLSPEEWLHLCRLHGWVSANANHSTIQ